MKIHPLNIAKESHVLAVRFDSNKWGYIRIHRGSALGIWDRWSSNLKAIPNNIEGRPEKWFSHYLSPKNDEVEMVDLGELPFESEEQAWAPPCFYAPDIFQNRFRIYYRGMFRFASSDEVVGIKPCERLNPTQIEQKLRRLFVEGLLSEI